jgi:hypothetical protein
VKEWASQRYPTKEFLLQIPLMREREREREMSKVSVKGAVVSLI